MVMTKEFVAGVAYTDLERAYSAYNTLMAVYENACGGPRGAMAHKEYFAIRDSRDNIRLEVINRSRGGSNGQ
jgi:hypothetical protein